MTADDSAGAAPARPRTAGKTRLLRWGVGVGVLAAALTAALVVLCKRERPPGRVTTAADCDGREECAPLCDRNEWQACTRLATLYWFPRGMKRDLARAESLYQRACDGGEPLACFSLGRMYGDALPMQDKAGKAPELLRLASEGFDRQCQAGQGRPCLDLAAMYQTGRGVERNAEKAAALQAKAAPILERDCQAGVARACADLSGLVFAGNGVSKDENRSVNLIERACELGDRRSCMRAAADFTTGRPHVTKEPARATKHLKKGCELQDQAACHLYAKALFDGTGVPTDAKEAARLQQQACDHQIAPACRELARMHAAGQGVKKDPSREADLSKRYLSLRANACAEGSAEDCAELARDYRNGDAAGVKLDPMRARDFEEQQLRFLQESCDAGAIMDCAQLRILLEGRPQYADRLRTVRERECQLGSREECRKLRFDKAIERGEVR